MHNHLRQLRRIILACVLPVSLSFSGCSSTQGSTGPAEADVAAEEELDRDLFLKFVDEEPDTVDPQCTSEYYTVPLNVFDRLVEVQVQTDGSSEIVPSLADSWQISEDGLVYTFHLHEGVTFSNGSPLTSSDVLYTLTRLLTHPDACNQDIAEEIRGALALKDGSAKSLEGFEIIDDLDFSITLETPHAAFLAALSTPGASILDEETTEAAGELFGADPSVTIGTGPFVFQEWDTGVGMVLAANKDCWSGAPRCEGLDIIFALDPEAQRLMFENGDLDILDLENLGSDAEFFIHGDIYRELLHQGPRVGISYVALNESIEPLNDVRVRQALQLALDRHTLLDAAYSGRGAVENGIFPHGLIGFNPKLPEIPYDPDRARELLKEAGYEEGFDLALSVSSSSTRGLKDLHRLIASMWQKIGVNASVEVLDDNEFMDLRKSGKLAVYSSTWSADYNDPDNFIYTFFGNASNTVSRSLCYPDEEIMDRVHGARAIVDEQERIREYQELERIIVRQDAAWIPLYSVEHYFAVSDRVEGFRVSWNGWSSNQYRDVAVTEK